MARREPTFHVAHIATQNGTHDGSQSGGAGGSPHAAVSHSGFSRFVSTLQIVASLLAVPLGLASGYSIYRANFSVETTCQSLRSNIIGMLDKNVDAGTRRMLVRRDIATFEQNCGSVDPDAHAAFKSLLAAGTPVTATVTATPNARTVAPPADAARKAGPRPVVTNKQPVAVDAPVTNEAAPTQRADSLSDARWLAAVRQALVTHGPERTDSAEPVVQATVKPLRAERPAVSKTSAPVLQSSWIAPPPAPAVPQPAPAVHTHAPQLIADHPVPPAPIPMLAPIGSETRVSMQERSSSHLGAWIAQIPLLGRVIEPRGN